VVAGTSEKVAERDREAEESIAARLRKDGVEIVLDSLSGSGPGFKAKTPQSVLLQRNIYENKRAKNKKTSNTLTNSVVVGKQIRPCPR
jgi:hypothetical protein